MHSLLLPADALGSTAGGTSRRAGSTASGSRRTSPGRVMGVNGPLVKKGSYYAQASKAKKPEQQRQQEEKEDAAGVTLRAPEPEAVAAPPASSAGSEPRSPSGGGGPAPPRVGDMGADGPLVKEGSYVRAGEGGPSSAFLLMAVKAVG